MPALPLLFLRLSGLLLREKNEDTLVPSSVLVTTSKALVTTSDALVPTSFLAHTLP